jgi:hypothetical protein
VVSRSDTAQLARLHLASASTCARSGDLVTARRHCLQAVDVASSDDTDEIDLGVRLNRQLTELHTTLTVLDRNVT